MIHAVKCDYPIHLHDNLVITSTDNQPALLGTNLTLSCPTKLVLVGPNISTCMENGEWEPDPKEVKCKGDK